MTQREAHCTESATRNPVAEAAVTCFTGAGAAAWGSLLRNKRGTLCTLLAPLSPAGCIGASAPEPVLSSPRTYSCGSQTFLWSRFWQIKAGIGVGMTLSPVPPKLCFVKVTGRGCQPGSWRRASVGWHVALPLAALCSLSDPLVCGSGSKLVGCPCWALGWG